jgi:hypothetical protein
VGVLSNFFSSDARNFALVSLQEDQLPYPADGATFVKDECYLSIFVDSLRITRERVFSSRYYGAVFSYASIERLGSKKTQLRTIVVPNNLKNIDPVGISRVITSNIRVAGPVPYRGGDIGLELGLVAVKSVDFASSYLQLVEDIAKTAGVGLIQSALPFAHLLEKGVNLLFGTNQNVKLLVGIDTNLEPHNSSFALIALEPQQIYGRKLKIRAEDRRLLNDDGSDFTAAPYLVFRIEGAKERDDWANIDYLRTSYEDYRSALERRRQNDAMAALERFRVNTLLSPDLIPGDAQRLYERADQFMKAVFKEPRRGKQPGAIVLPTLELLNLYDK